MYFDPGQRYCEYGRLHWMHTGILGIRQTEKGVELASTPNPPYPDNQVLRTADLTLGADGTVTGTVRVTMGGAEALRWRQMALRTDEDATKRAFEQEMQRRVPEGVHVKTNHFLGLTDPSSALMAVMDVSGSLGTRTGKRVFLPSGFFEAGARPLFDEQKRETMIDLHYPYVARDEVNIQLPSGLTVEALPAAAKIPMENEALYQMLYGNKGGEFQEIRQLTLGTPLYKAAQYGELRDFFQKAAAQDQQPVVLERLATAAAGAAAAAGKSE
jgi:hypothetical protein